MAAKSELMRLQGLRPWARAATFPPCYATGSQKGMKNYGMYE